MPSKTDSGESAAPTDEPVSSLDQAVRVKDLTSPETNPNIPRSLFATAVGSADADADQYISVTDANHQPGKGFSEKSIKAKAIQMNAGFDANGVPGNAGDWLVYASGHWFIAKEV